MLAHSRSLVGLFLALVVVAPVHAEFINVGTEVLDDGWVRYTYTVESPAAKGLQSFVLTSEFVPDVRHVTQPTNWMGYVVDDHLSWARDIYWPHRECRVAPLVFSFESAALPDLIRYRARGFFHTVRGTILGPGLAPAGVPTTMVTTPEPTSLGLFGLGGGLWWLARRRRREPA